MKILVIGDSNSIFIKQYIEYVLLDEGRNQIVLIEENSTNGDYMKFYSEHGVAVEPRVNEKNRILARIPKIRAGVANRIWCSQIRKKYGRFDLVHIHGLNYSRGNIALYTRGNTEKLAITVWGDEIFRVDDKTAAAYQKYYDVADRITVSTTDMYRKFDTVYGGKYRSVVTMNKFGIGVLDYIDQVKKLYSREQICREYGIRDPDKRTVFVGHNGRAAQRHLEITKSLAALSEAARKNITLVYTMTYGVPGEDYLNSMVAEAQKLGCDFVVLRKYMNEIQTAKLRSICDVMLHAQLTDAFSASICESLYAGAVIFNGSWLQYNDLPDHHRCFVEYDQIEEIPGKLEMLLEDFDVHKSSYAGNTGVIRDICSREATTQKWKQSLFEM